MALRLGLREEGKSRACFGAAQWRLGGDWGRGAVRQGEATGRLGSAVEERGGRRAPSSHAAGGVLECAVQSACRRDGDRAGVRGEGGACSPSPAAFEHLALKFCALSTESKMAKC